MSACEYKINYDENKIPEYELPSALIDKAGNAVNTVSDWLDSQRQYILELFEENVYGKLPGMPDAVEYEYLKIKKDAFGGSATRKEIRIHLLMDNGGRDFIDLLLYVPNNAHQPSPVFLGSSFYGNQSCSLEDDILLSEKWMRPVEKAGIINNRVTELSRGYYASRWPVEKIIKRGYALAAFYCGDCFPDDRAGRDKSIYKLFESEAPTNISGGAISAWAWGLSRGMDYLEKDPDICAGKVAVVGHSRLGKAALWAGAQDQRFSIMISNNSGCCGASLTRRFYGENLEIILDKFPHWFCGKLKDYAGKENLLPLDQHMLLCLSAPRPVYIASASEDFWADPYGEFLATVHAGAVYKLWGLNGIEADMLPKLNQPIKRDIGYHIRAGKHDITAFDWGCFMDFADKCFMRNKRPNIDLRQV